MGFLVVFIDFRAKWGKNDPPRALLGDPGQAKNGPGTTLRAHSGSIRWLQIREIPPNKEHEWGEVIGPCPKGGWQGPMTSLLDPGVPWSTLEGQGPERVPQGPE